MIHALPCACGCLVDAFLPLQLRDLEVEVGETRILFLWGLVAHRKDVFDDFEAVQSLVVCSEGSPNERKRRSWLAQYS